MIGAFIIFGASGDLTSRYLIPALARLREADELPDSMKILGIASSPWDTRTFRERMSKNLEKNCSQLSSKSRASLVSQLEYQQADVTDSRQVAKSLEPLNDPVIVHLALPPPVFGPAIEALKNCGLPGGSRIVIEKPFGESVASAQNLNQLLHERFPEGSVFRIDHFLGKQTVQNLLGLRFANRFFEPLWNSQHIAKVEIRWDETVTAEGRAGYYDQSGALRDMCQNHLLQLLCLAGMEAVPCLDERELRARKIDVLRAVRRMSAREVEEDTIRARYGAGCIGSRDVPAYVEEPGVDPRRNTETFAQILLHIDNQRWKGVPFVLRTGKALAKNRQEIVIHFKSVPHFACDDNREPEPNILRLSLKPDRISLAVNINGPGDPFILEPAQLEMELAPQEPTAYGRLFLDILNGKPTFFIRDDEAEESWRIIEPILQGWKEGRSPLREYPAGSTGPA